MIQLAHVSCLTGMFSSLNYLMEQTENRLLNTTVTRARNMFVIASIKTRESMQICSRPVLGTNITHNFVLYINIVTNKTEINVI